MSNSNSSVPAFAASHRTIVPGRYVAVCGGMTTVEVPKAQNLIDPRVEIVRENDSIKNIEIICSCGRHIHLHCQY